jgi:hypothetical protein
MKLLKIILVIQEVMFYYIMKGIKVIINEELYPNIGT